MPSYFSKPTKIMRSKASLSLRLGS
uniref:Uncharacterized protein n=1 Tax=Lepeophtheirus salmonis TaxID=72036 RepID=A0A0K2VB86_LEPSM